MAVLQNIFSKESQLLHLNNTVGRNKSNITYLNSLDVSKTHATIFWENDQWHLKDHSRNGTTVNNTLIHQQTILLKIHSKIQFGSEFQNIWELASIAAPKSYLRNIVDNNVFFDLSSQDIIPNQKKKQSVFYQSKLLKWMIDDGHTTRELLHNTKYTFNDLEWLFIENDPIEETQEYLNIVEQASLECYLSLDEESVEIKIKINELEMNLGERVHNYLIYLLTQKKLEDECNQYPIEEQGWIFVDNLVQNLSKELLLEIDAYYLNVMIHRLRNHLKSLKPYGHLFADIIERKRGKLRLTNSNVKIIKYNKEFENIQLLN